MNTPTVSTSPLGGLISLTSDTGDALALLNHDQAVGLAATLALHVGIAVPDNAYDLKHTLLRLAGELNSALSAWQRDSHATPATWHPDPYTNDGTWPAVPDSVTAQCCNSCVGVIITDPDGRLLLFRRMTFPVGIAPVAGHIDEHGDAEDAARAEVTEELGLTVTTLTRHITRWRPNICRRRHGSHGPGHDWTVFHAEVTGDLTPAPDEAAEPRWYTQYELQHLALLTARYASGRLTDAEFTTEPGLEPVWADFLHELGFIKLTPRQLAHINDLATRSPYRDDRATGGAR